MKPLILALLLAGACSAPGYAQTSSSTITRTPSTRTGNYYSPTPAYSTQPSGSALGSMYGYGNSLGTGTGGGGAALGGTYYGASGLGPAPGVGSYTGLGLTPAQALYYRASGRLPAAPAPLAAGSGYYQLGGLRGGVNFWLSPSGYYYPWGGGSFYSGAPIYPTQTIYVFQQGAFNEAKPAVPQVIGDMRNFIEDAKSKGQLDQSAYEGLAAKLNDIEARAGLLAQKNGGLLDTSDDATMRRELDGLITDITRSLNP